MLKNKGEKVRDLMFDKTFAIGQIYYAKTPKQQEKWIKKYLKAKNKIKAITKNLNEAQIKQLQKEYMGKDKNGKN